MTKLQLSKVCTYMGFFAHDLVKCSHLVTNVWTDHRVFFRVHYVDIVCTCFYIHSREKLENVSISEQNMANAQHNT